MNERRKEREQGVSGQWGKAKLEWPAGPGRPIKGNGLHLEKQGVNHMRGATRSHLPLGTDQRGRVSRSGQVEARRMMAAKTREKWAYQEIGRQYVQMSLGMALDVVVGEGRSQAGVWLGQREEVRILEPIKLVRLQRSQESSPDPGAGGVGAAVWP